MKVRGSGASQYQSLICVRRALRRALLAFFFSTSLFSSVPKVSAATPSLSLNPASILSGGSVLISGDGYPARRCKFLKGLAGRPGLEPG